MSRLYTNVFTEYISKLSVRLHMICYRFILELSRILSAPPLHTYRFRARSHIAPKNAWKTLGALLSPFFQSARAVALRRHLSLLSNHQLRSPLQEGNFVT